MARTVSQFSKAERQKVGAILVSREGKIIGTGYNGTPSGVDNKCETEDGSATVEHVIHAELNSIFNATTHDLAGSTLYVTLSPCTKCASAIIQKKIKRVVYSDNYRCLAGIEFLTKHGVEVEQHQELVKSEILEPHNFNGLEQLKLLADKLGTKLDNVMLEELHRSFNEKVLAQISKTKLLGNHFSENEFIYDLLKYALSSEESTNAAKVRFYSFKTAILFQESLHAAYYFWLSNRNVGVPENVVRTDTHVYYCDPISREIFIDCL